MTTDIAIQAAGVGKVYPSPKGDIAAVADLCLSVPVGRIFGLLGPNGAGKTTTIRMLCGLIRPTTGQVWIDGLPVADRADEVRRRIGLVPEDAGDYKTLTLLEELEYHGALHGMDRRAVRRQAGPLIDRLGLAERAGHRLGTFSRGMRRKFHLIRALLHRPRILLLDEPTAGLDPQSTEEVWVLLKALAAENHVTVILCSHHLEEVERLCDQVAIMRRKLLVEGAMADLRRQGRCYRIELACAAEHLAPAIRQVAGVEQATFSGTALQVNLAGPAADVMPQVVRRLVDLGAEIIEVVRQDRDLRSLYREAILQTETASAGGPP